MGYTKRTGPSPLRVASKSAHSHVINDPAVKALLDQCRLPKQAGAQPVPSH